MSKYKVGDRVYGLIPHCRTCTTPHLGIIVSVGEYPYPFWYCVDVHGVVGYYSEHELRLETNFQQLVRETLEAEDVGQ